MSHPLKRLLAVLSLLVITGQGCTNAVPPETAVASKRTELNIWAVIDDEGVYDAILNDYRRLHPNIQFNFRRLRLEQYESELLNALAEDRGPDVFMIHNDWTGKYLPKIAPMPLTTKVAQQVITGTLKKVETWQLQNEPTLKVKDIRDLYADVIAKDTVRTIDVSTDPSKQVMQERAMGIALSMDTLALFYNKDLLNAAGIPNPPETWTQFQDQAKKLVKLDPQGNIVQAAVGMGTAYNVERGVDVLQALMIQNGAQMADDNGSPAFQQIPKDLNREFPPSYQALEFYTDFANPAKETFTWDSKQPNSLDAFIAGKTAFFFGYSFDVPLINARAPKLNLGMSKLPQIDGNPTKNFANYWYWTVSKKTKSPDIAWNLLNFMAKPEESKKFLDAAKRPAARKSQLTAQLDDDVIGVFAAQVLTATSWYRGKDPKAVEEAFLTMINDVQTGAQQIDKAVNFAAQKVSQTIY